MSLAIFVTVMASVALAFNTAVRTSKQGFQNQEAYELARGMMKVLERDLGRAFTNRDHGDDFSFYGTPIGFTYVGLISADESASANMSRVTYVIYHDQFSTLAGSVGQYQSRDGVMVPTYYLLRYLEPGADSLDSFPVPWSDFIDQDTLNVRLQGLVDQTVLSTACPDAACDNLVAQAAKREIWIRMLAGGDSEVPSAWDDLDYFTSRNLRPEDFVIGENIRYMDPGLLQCAPTRVELEELISLDYDDYVFTNDAGSACVITLSSMASAPVFLPTTPAAFDPSSDPRPFFTYFDLGIIGNDPNTTVDDKVAPIPFQFWNDWRNLLADGRDNDNDTEVDEADERYGENIGSPLDTRLPLAVTTDFTLFFRSPYVGAPDFNERFTQRIDLPVGARRSLKSPSAAP